MSTLFLKIYSSKYKIQLFNSITYSPLFAIILSDVLLNVVFNIESFPFQSILQAMDKSNNRMLQVQGNTAGWIEDTKWVPIYLLLLLYEALCLHGREHNFCIDERNTFWPSLYGYVTAAGRIDMNLMFQKSKWMILQKPPPHTQHYISPMVMEIYPFQFTDYWVA